MNISKGNAFVAISIVVLTILSATIAAADPHAGQSVNVALIGGTFVSSGGSFPTTGTGFSDFTFTNMDPANVTAANLTSYDTALLNVHSSQFGNCNLNVLSPSQKNDLIAWIGLGNKLIIYDSECTSVDYSWLPYQFTTANPGALGATGTLTIVEENLLSTSAPADPHYIDAATLASTTDAVGDMNVFTTYDGNWCIDMSGRNAIAATGPVHAYAIYPVGQDMGLFIYNGLDVDTMPHAILNKIWLQELQQPFDPSNLPCVRSASGISLTPHQAVNPVDTTHTVTAKVVDGQNNSIAGVTVTFNVTSGPNAGTSGTNVTDVNGEATFTYTGSGGVGIDEIKASFTDSNQILRTSNTVTKEWNSGGTSGISLTPNQAVNPVDTTHMVTAKVVDGQTNPIVGVTVTFNVTSGPNAGASGTNVTDANGEATFTYTGSGGVGIDEIKASFTDSNQILRTSNTVTKEWNGGGTSVPEFPSLVVPVAGIMGIVLLLFRRREN